MNFVIYLKGILMNVKLTNILKITGLQNVCDYNQGLVDN